MAKARRSNLAQAFSGATTTVERQEKIKSLQAELEKTKTEKTNQQEKVLEALRQELKNYSGEQDIPISKMHPSHQARQTFTKSAVSKRAESLKQHGQLTPVILIPIQQDKEEIIFEIEDGELRWRAANLLVESGHKKWSRLKAVIAPLPTDATELHKRSLVHNLHREDLNNLDRIEAIVEQIVSTVDLALSPKEIESGLDKRQAAELKIKRTIQNLDYRFKRNPQDRAKLLKLLEAPCEEQLQGVEAFELPEVHRDVLKIFLELQLNISSVAANDLPMLTVPRDLKQAIRTQGLQCRHAQAIAKLDPDKLRCSEDKAVKQRQTVVEEVISRNLSLINTRKLVAQVLESKGSVQEKRSKNKKEAAEVKAALSQVSLQVLDKKELKSLKKVLAQKLEEIEHLLGEKTN